MSKMSIDPARHALNGPTMGTTWSTLFFAPPDVQVPPIRAALQAAVDQVNAQMSTWKPDSDLMRLNTAPVGVWVDLPAPLLKVLGLALEIGRASGGAFDIAVGDAVTAWGFGASAPEPALIRAALSAPHRPAYDVLELDPSSGRARRTAPVAFDLNGIAKGYGVDQLADTLHGFGIAAALVGLDGEMRATGLRPDGALWTIALEAPDPGRRAPHSILALQNAAVATSGDYRHWIEVQGQRLSHTIDPQRGGPLQAPPASVTVIAQSCAEADAWATALIVLGEAAGAALARRHGLDALFVLRDGPGLRSHAVGALFQSGENLAR